MSLDSIKRAAMAMLRPKKLFPFVVPELEEFVGRTVKIKGRDVLIKTIVGNRFKQAFYEINGNYLINMLRFHAQMEGDTSITEAQFKAFEETQGEVEKMKAPSFTSVPKEGEKR